MSQAVLIQTLAVALGGAVGAAARFLTNHWIRSWWHDPFPLATLTVNVTGSFLLGLLTAMMLDNSTWPVWARVALGAGVMGALTTFSTFSLETILLLEQGAFGRALLSVLLNVTACLAAVWIGLVVAR